MSAPEDSLPHEIERRYLLTGMPKIPEGAETIRIEQGWLPGQRFRERVRATTLADGVSVVHHRGFKLGKGLSRIEIEEPTTPEIFAALWPLTLGCRVLKARVLVREPPFLWEIDRFLDRELFLAEVELPDLSSTAPIPGWLRPLIDREVTEEGAFTNLVLAR